MGIRITCPSCRSIYTVDDALDGKMVRCRECDGVIPVHARRGRDDSADDDRARPDRRVAARPPRRPRDGGDDEAPRRVTRRDREDDGEAPRRRPARGRDDDDDRPRRRSAPASDGPSPALLIGIGAAALLLVGGAVGGLFLALRPSSAAPAPPPAASLVSDNPGPGDGGLAPRPAPAALDPGDLQRVKRATVYLRVDLPNGGVAEGTGFFAVEPGVIVTNAHVLGMLTPDSVTPRNVTVAVHSGEPGEFKVRGVVLGVDRTNDLAVLRTDATPAPLPAPLQVDSADRLIETQKVFVFGFPLGARLGKNVTVSESSVSSLRRDDSGAVSQVQVNGGMQPGNSGGPVTDTRGVAVGVSVAIIRGTQINFAIPGEFVTRVLAGRLAGHDVGTPYAVGGRTHLPVRLTTLDPLRRVREVRLDVWTGAPGAPTPATGQAPQARPGDGVRQSLAATARDGWYGAEVPLPPLPGGHVYWAQPAIVDVTGATQWGAARVVPFDPGMVLERRSAHLQFKAPTAPTERTLRLSSNSTLNIFRGDDQAAVSMKMDGQVLESLGPDPRGVGTFVRLTLTRPRFTRESGGRRAAPPPALGAYLAQYSPTFLVDGTNRARERGNRSFSSIPPQFRGSVEELFETLCNTWEVTTLPLPNRVLQPQESWAAQIPMLVTLEGKKEVRFLHVTCTYEGQRTVAGRAEAFVLLSGVVKGVGKHADDTLGKVAGHALIDLTQGSLSQVKITISCEIDNEDAGVRLLVTDESSVERVEGNPLGIKAAVPPENRPPVDTRPPDNRTPPAGWREYTPRTKTFTVWLPQAAGVTKESVRSSPPKRGSTLRLLFTTVAVEARAGPVFSASSVSISPMSGVGKTSALERVDWVRDLLRDGVGGRVGAEKQIKQGRVPGKEFLIESGAATARCRVYALGDKLFVVSVTGNRAYVGSQEAVTFLDSYRIPDNYTGLGKKGP